MILISACNITPAKENYNFRTGTEGLDVRIKGEDEIKIYGSSNPSPETYIIEVENKGATKISSSDIYMRITLPDGFFKNYNDQNFELSSLKEFENNKGPSELEGKTKYTSKGDIVVHGITLQPTVPPTKGVGAKINIDLCYKYSTILIETVCVNTQHHKEGEGCKQSKYTFSGQGAPIKISSVEIKEMIEDDTFTPMVVLVIDNTEENIFTLPDKHPEACKAKSDINKLRIEKATLGTNTLVCNEEERSEISIRNEEKKVVCMMEGDFDDVDIGYLETPLYVQLDYSYYSHHEKKVSIIREDY